MSNLTAFDYSYENNILEVKYKPINRELNHWCDEIDNTVKAISQSTSKPIYIGFSGGIDSEVVINSFIKNNIPFKVLIVEFSNDLNKHDIDFAKEYCNNNNISYISVPLNVNYFFTEGVDRYVAQGYKAIRIFRYLQLFILETIESMGGCAVLGSICDVN